MSCYNWERGTITIPAKEWAKFRTAVIKAWNEHQLDRFEKAKRMHAKAKEAIKGKRGSKRQEALRALADRWEGREETAEFSHKVIGYEYNRETRRDTVILKNAPKKKDFEIFPTSKSCGIHMLDGSIELNNENRTVTWSVGENNRAVEHARKHPVARKMFGLLDRINWTRGSGGKIIGNDEYNRDADYDGGGGNYVTAEYSQAKQKRDREARARSRYGGGFNGYGGYSRRW